MHTTNQFLTPHLKKTGSFKPLGGTNFERNKEIIPNSGLLRLCGYLCEKNTHLA